MEEIQEKALHRDTASVVITPKIINFDEIDEEVQLAVRLAADKQAIDLKVLDLRDVTSFTEFFVIASGANQRQVQAIVDEVREKMKEITGLGAIRIEGYAGAEWVLLDYGDFIVHVFDKNAREFYDLEHLWLDATKVPVPENL